MATKQFEGEKTTVVRNQILKWPRKRFWINGEVMLRNAHSCHLGKHIHMLYCCMAFASTHRQNVNLPWPKMKTLSPTSVIRISSMQIEQLTCSFIDSWVSTSIGGEPAGPEIHSCVSQRRHSHTIVCDGCGGWWTISSELKPAHIVFPLRNQSPSALGRGPLMSTVLQSGI